MNCSWLYCADYGPNGLCEAHTPPLGFISILWRITSVENEFFTLPIGATSEAYAQHLALGRYGHNVKVTRFYDNVYTVERR
jgi:hypothetical protein